MKIGIFTDSHYSSKPLTCGKRYNSLSLEKIKDAYAFFEKEKCELVVCLGDLIDTENTVEMEIDNLAKIGTLIRRQKVPTVCLMGNHDAFVLTPRDFYATLQLEPPRDLCLSGNRLIFLDACFFKNGRHYAPGDSDWKDTFLPNEEALRRKLSEIPGSAHIFIHQNIDPGIREDHRIANWDRVFEIINQSGVVKTVFQGHYHPGFRSEHSGVQYITLPAMCEHEQAFWVFDI